MTPPECDLRGYDFMPLLGQRMFTSEFYLRSSAEGFRAGIRLLWAAWQQCPAGSLPDDDVMLCRLADLGTDLKRWRKLRPEALKKFIKCSDGRLYNPILSEWVLTAWKKRLRERERKSLYRAKREAGVPWDGTGTGRGQDGDRTGTSASCPSREGEREGEGEGYKKERKKPLTPSPGGDGGLESSEDGKEKDGRPDGWAGQWRGLRANGTNPRAAAAAAPPAPPPPEPDHPLWPALKARGVKAHEFRTWIAPLAQTEPAPGEVAFAAPSQFHAAQIRANFAIPLAAATGRRVVVTVAS
jgi:hypothetical protein